jgi:thiol:disulfide interchange protein
MNVVVKILVAIVIGVLVMWLLDLVIAHSWAVLLGIIAGVAYFLYGSETFTQRR